eukprot:m.282517 g.282517  ORF g.282517 m.282517 type:complete len:82 (+) comp16186_c0_seq16:6582-6827(+)
MLPASRFAQLALSNARTMTFKTALSRQSTSLVTNERWAFAGQTNQTNDTVGLRSKHWTNSKPKDPPALDIPPYSPPYEAFQ